MGGAPLTSLGPHCGAPSLGTLPLRGHPQSVLVSPTRLILTSTSPLLHFFMPASHLSPPAYCLVSPPPCLFPTWPWISAQPSSTC